MSAMLPSPVTFVTGCTIDRGSDTSAVERAGISVSCSGLTLHRWFSVLKDNQSCFLDTFVGLDNKIQIVVDKYFHFVRSHAFNLPLSKYFDAGRNKSLANSNFCGAFAGERCKRQKVLNTKSRNCFEPHSERMKVNYASFYWSRKLLAYHFEFAERALDPCNNRVDMNERDVHVSRRNARHGDLHFFSTRRFSGSNPDSSCQRADGSDCGYPIGPFSYSQGASLFTHFAPRNPNSKRKSSKGCHRYRSDNYANWFMPSHQSSDLSWRNRNTASIGGGK